MVILKATRWLTPCLSALAGVSAALLFCNPAAAEACDDQGACPRGFVCEAHRENVVSQRPVLVDGHGVPQGDDLRDHHGQRVRARDVYRRCRLRE